MKTVSAGINWAALRPLAHDLRIGILVLLVLEVVLRVAAPDYGRRLFDQEFTGSHPILINEDSCRGDTISPLKPASQVRILALGDSVTFGTGVAADDAWPCKLGRLVSKTTNRQAGVINAAVPAASLNELRASYETAWRRYRPDVVALAVTGNMVSLGWIRRGDALRPPERWPQPQPMRPDLRSAKMVCSRIVHRFCCPSFLTQTAERARYWMGLSDHRLDPRAPFGPLLAYGYRQADLDPAIADTAWGMFADDLRKMRDAVAADGAELVVTFVPCRFQVSDAAFDNEKALPRDRLTIDPVARFNAICDSEQVAHADALAAIREHRRAQAAERGRTPAMYVSFDFTHLSEDGHAAVAEALAPSMGAMN